MSLKKINDIADIEGSILGSLEKYKVIWVARGACMYFWESFSELRAWARNFDAKVEPKDNGFLITKEQGS